MTANPNPHPRITTFRVSCAVLGIAAFVELMSAAVALAARFESSRAVRVVEKVVEVPKIVEVQVPAPPSAHSPKTDGIVARPPLQENPAPPKPPEPEPTPLATPPIADPTVERLVTEARTARVAEDMGAAIVKLEEAGARTPDEPNVEYELGLVYETMEVFDKASSHYEKVFNMGATKAGVLYEMAAAKLRDGLQKPDPHGKFVLGRTRIFRDTSYPDGERVVLTIPIQVAPGFKVGDDFSVVVLFYNQVRGKEIVPGVQDQNMVKLEWVSGPMDWAGGEELLRATYIIPPQDEQTEHLFGKRTYYGQTVTLSYKNEVVDVQAWPRDLAARGAIPPAQPQQQDNGLPGPGDVPPEFLNKEDGPGVLPPLPSH